MGEYNAKDLCAVLSQVFQKTNQVFFSYAWREKLEEIMTEEKRYGHLVEWLNREIGAMRKCDKRICAGRQNKGLSKRKPCDVHGANPKAGDIDTFSGVAFG